MDLYIEVDRISAGIESLLGRRPTPIELSNHALAIIDHDVEREAFPALCRLRGIHGNATGADGQPADDGTIDQPDYVDIDERRGNADEVRFVTLIERYALSSCVDGCPACLGGSCDIASPALSRALVSRRLLRELLLELLRQRAIDVDAYPTAQTAAETALSDETQGWVIVYGHAPERFAAVKQLLLGELSPFEEIVDYASGNAYGIYLRLPSANA